MSRAGRARRVEVVDGGKHRAGPVPVHMLMAASGQAKVLGRLDAGLRPVPVTIGGHAAASYRRRVNADF